MKKAILLFLLFLLSACVEQPVRKGTSQDAVSDSKRQACACESMDNLPPIQIPDAERYTLPAPVKAGEIPKGPEYQLLRPTNWESVEGFAQDNQVAAWSGLLQSCGVLKKQEPWRAACEAAEALPLTPDNETIRGYLRQNFVPYQLTNTDGNSTGLITGYYEPLMRASRAKTERYRYPLYARPDDLITVELNGLYPELSGRRLRGRVMGNKLEPYYSRGEIEIATSPLAGKELLWVEDIIDLFFLQIQGSGMLKLDSGEQVHVGYADQNGQPYQSIGKLLIERGELTSDKASMQGIKEWARRNLNKVRDLLNSNPSYVFFRELPEGLSGPLGALGVPLAAERSIAIDPRYVPLGAPVFLSTTYPNSRKPLQRLMMAQDTGGAIKGAVRADFFWGAGMEAGRQAGSMKQPGKMWVLLPKEIQIP